MKPIILATVALSALSANPGLAQQSADDFVPGVNFLANWDMDEDGKITLDELNERRGDIFAAFDENEDGELSVAEFDAYDAARKGAMQRPEDRGNGGGRGEQALSRAATDTDGDGTVTLDEFRAASAAWLGIMDGNADGVVTVEDFGPGARQAGGGQGHGRNQDMGQGQRAGQDDFRGQGKGRAEGRGPGRGNGGPDMNQDRQKGTGMAYGQRGNQGRGHGQQGGQGKGRTQQGVAFQGFPTADGALWIVDERTGDILVCKAVTDSNAAAGFVPVCVEADL